MTPEQLRTLTTTQRRALWLEHNPPKGKQAMQMTKEELKAMFLPLEMTAEQAELVYEFNLALYKLGGAVMLNVPMCREAMAAYHKLQEAGQWFALAARKKKPAETPIDKVEKARAKQNPLESRLDEADNWEGPKE